MAEENREIALVTGASLGLGKEMAEILASQGYDLVIVSRSEDKLLELKKNIITDYQVNVTSIPIDLSLIDAAERLHEKVEERGLAVSVLVNNAGIGSYGPFIELSAKVDEQMQILNMLTLTKLTRLFVKPMIERKKGAILNVASTAAFQPGPWSATYYATKAYVLSFSEALYAELKGTGVRVSTLCPGPTLTTFQLRSKMIDSRAFHSPMVEKNPRRVAHRGIMAMQAGKRLVVSGLLNKLLIFSARFMPRFLVLWLTGKMMSRHHRAA